MNRAYPFMFALLLAAALVFSGCSNAAENGTDVLDDPDASGQQDSDDQGSDDQAEEPQEARAEVGNEICPSSGQPVNEDIYAVHNGWKVNFFCPNCRNSFVGDPEQYADRIQELTEVDIRQPAPQTEETEGDGS